MRPLGQTRPLLAYGVPAAAGLVAGGALAAQGEDPGSAVLGGIAAGLGARGALGAARMAGRYAPAIGEMAQKAIVPVGKAVAEAASQTPLESKRRQGLERGAQFLRNRYQDAGQISPGMVQKTVAAGAVPLAAGVAGLGGLAAGGLAGAIGIPGFQQGIDPEGYSSNNTDMARMGVPTMQYM